MIIAVALHTCKTKQEVVIDAFSHEEDLLINLRKWLGERFDWYFLSRKSEASSRTIEACVEGVDLKKLYKLDHDNNELDICGDKVVIAHTDYVFDDYVHLDITFKLV